MGNEGVASIIKALRARRGVSTTAKTEERTSESKETSARPVKAPKKKAAKKRVVKRTAKSNSGAKTKVDRSASKERTKTRVSKSTAKERVKKASASEASGRSFGQSGPKIDLTTAKLNQKELAVLNALNERAGSMTIGEIAEECFKGVPSSVANSMVRNALRRLVRGEAVEKVEKGVYQG